MLNNNIPKNPFAFTQDRANKEINFIIISDLHMN